MAPIHLEVPLEDTIAEEKSIAVLELKMTSSDVLWYKDGLLQLPSPTVSLRSIHDVHRLEISPVTLDAYGLYYAVSNSYTAKRVQTKAALYVARSLSDGHERTIYSFPHKFESVAPVCHLSDQHIEYGRTVELELKLQSTSAIEYYWYKSNVPIVKNSRTMIINSSSSTSLYVMDAVDTDSGIYHVVARTALGIVGSFAKVIVNMVPKERTPYVLEALPEEVECHVHDDVRIMCKVRVDAQTSIRWSKNGIEINDNEIFRREDYGNGYIGLKISRVQVHDTAGYVLTLRNEMSDLTDTTRCFVTVNKIREIPIPIAELKKPLRAIVACLGTHIVMKCKFELKSYDYFYVVWQVGRYRVERTNHLFSVANYDGDYYLAIKCLAANMAGLISCELRCAYPNRKSVFVANTSANLAVVPPAFIDEEIRKKPKPKRRFVYLTPLNIVLEIDVKTKMRASRFKSEERRRTESLLLKSRAPTEPLEILYCRTDNDRLSFLEVAKQSVYIKGNSIVVYNKNEGIYQSNDDEDFEQRIEIKWNPLRSSAWFHIELLQPDGMKYNGGVTSVPKFEIRNPPPERILKFTVAAIPDCGGESTVSIRPPLENAPRSSAMCQIKTLDDFGEEYGKIGEKIGSGAFGTVSLVRSARGEYFAAKILKTKTDKKRATAMREYEIMRVLKHPKLIELVDVFVSKDTFIFVMDYLWGGELFDRIVEQEFIKELDVVYYIRQILEALQYLHSMKIAHLDLKPENIICLNYNARLIKLIDFGLARVLDDDHGTRAIYGTRDYVAPEVLNYDRLTVACDMWSLGVVTYLLLSGVMPFAGDTWAERSTNITMASYNFDDPAFADVSDLAKTFINSLLVRIPQCRLDATVALNHRWITHGPPTDARTTHMRRTRRNLKSYLATYRGRWQVPRGVFKTTGYWLGACTKNRSNRARGLPYSM